MLRSELRQAKPRPDIHAEAFLNLVRTSGQMQHTPHLKLKPYGITETQYNCLRILGDAGERGLACAEIGERLAGPDPDIRRLLGRLQRQGLVRRERGGKDRRAVPAKIAAAGLAKLKETDPAVGGAVNALLRHISQPELRQMIDLLERVQGGNESKGECDPG